MKRGVRQGCTLAPVHFSAFTAYYLHVLEARTSKQWVSSNASLFADDSHLAWEIEPKNDLNQMQKMIQITFALFAELGMQVNPEKSILIFGLRGRSLRKWIKKGSFIVRRYVSSIWALRLSLCKYRFKIRWITLALSCPISSLSFRHCSTECTELPCKSTDW